MYIEPHADPEAPNGLKSRPIGSGESRRLQAADQETGPPPTVETVSCKRAALFAALARQQSQGALDFFEGDIDMPRHCRLGGVAVTRPNRHENLPVRGERSI